MADQEGGFWVLLISPQVLAQYMSFRQLTVRQLAKKAGCSRALVGHLRTGYRKTCRPDIAQRIERALEAPPGSLFGAEVSPVVENTSRKGAA